MIALILAQRPPVGVDDWVEIIVLILIFGGTIFAAIAKKLIAMFSPDETGAAQDEPLEVEDDDVTTVSPPRPARPAYPVARPLPPRLGAPAPSAPPTVQPTPVRPGPRPVTAEVTPEETVWPSPVEVRPSTPVPPPSAPPRPRRPVRVPSDPGSAPPARRPAPPPRARPAQPFAADEYEPADDTFDYIHPEEELEHIHPEAEREHLHPEDDLGHLDPKAHLGHVAATLKTKPASRDISTARPLMVGPLTGETLRRAIVMNEILGPPRALRDFDEPR